MTDHLMQQFLSLAVTLLAAGLIWIYYRRKRFPVAARYMTFGPRFWSGWVDSCVLWPVAFVTSTLLLLEVPKMVAAMLVVVENLAWLVYAVVMHARSGQTVGKAVTKVRVVDFRTEGGISWHQAWVRESIPIVLSLGCLGYEAVGILNGTWRAYEIRSGEATVDSHRFWLLAALPALWFLAEVLTMLTNEKRRALHDFIAGTVVIRTNIDEAVTESAAAGEPSAKTTGMGN
jgi:uncharacterized RDD family membrane protein YckC